jgi:exonuclease VII small subunit
LNTESIIEELEAERDRFNDAIAALQNGRGPGRRGSNGRRGRRHLSAAARKKIGDAAKKRWAKIKAAGKNKL